MKKIVLILSLIMFTGGIKASDIDFYGNISTTAFWVHSERFWYDSLGFDSLYNPIYGEDTLPPVVVNDWLPTGMFGVNFKANNFSGCVEFSAGKNTYDALLAGSPTLRLVYEKQGYYLSIRKWYFNWQFNEMFSLLAGQDFSPTSFTQNMKMLWYEQGFNNPGVLFTGMQPMFQLTIRDPNSIIEGKVAAVKVDTSLIYVQAKITGNTYVSESKAPKTEGSFGVNIDKDVFALNAKAAGGFQRYSTVCFEQQLPVADSKLKIDSYLYGVELGARVGFISAAFNFFGGQNLGPYGVDIGPDFGWWRLNDFQYMHMFYPTQQKVSDTSEEWGFYNSKANQLGASLNVRPFEAFSIGGGFGMILGEHEYEPWNSKWQECLDGEIESYSWFAQASITVLEQITIKPEIGQYVNGKWKGFGRYLYWGLLMGAEF